MTKCNVEIRCNDPRTQQVVHLYDALSPLSDAGFFYD